MEITLVIQLVLIFFFHWVADFLCQTQYMAEFKSKSRPVLTLHVVVYTVVFTFLMFIGQILELKEVIVFLGLIFLSHWFTDYATSRLTSPQFAAKKYNGWDGAFTIVGFDQWMHLTQILTILYIVKNGFIQG